jgi:3-methyladenine DNA glycosylase AlkD
MNELETLKAELRLLSNLKKAEGYQRFFKTGKGEYGEGDVFLGITTPMQKQLTRKYHFLSLEELQKLLDSHIHEHRGIALGMLVNKYKKANKNAIEKRKIFQFYLNNTHRINNWDLVDCSAYKILGEFLLEEKSDILRQLAKSSNLWERRIAIISTFTFIKKRNFGETLAIADMLLKDEHDLIHKAVGWMLREIGKKNQDVLEIFLKPRYKEMPRTMLRYAIERFDEEKRQKYLKGEI